MKKKRAALSQSVLYVFDVFNIIVKYFSWFHKKLIHRFSHQKQYECVFLQTRMRKRIIKMKKYLFTNNRRKEKKENYYILKSNSFYVSIQYPLFLVKLVFSAKITQNAKIENMNPVNRFYVNQDNDIHSACLKIE